MKPRILLVNPPIYDFSAYDFWLKPYGLLRVAGFLRAQADFCLFDYLDRLDPRVPPGRYRSDPWGRGEFYSQRAEKPQIFGEIRRQFRRFGIPRREFQNFRSEEHTSELQSHHELVCRLLLEKKTRAEADLPRFTGERIKQVVSRRSWDIKFATGSAKFKPDAVSDLRAMFKDLVVAGVTIVSV